jgi:hypothetical protein
MEFEAWVEIGGDEMKIPEYKVEVNDGTDEGIGKIVTCYIISQAEKVSTFNASLMPALSIFNILDSTPYSYLPVGIQSKMGQTRP